MNSNSGIAVDYSNCSVRKVKQTFGITTIEGGLFFTAIKPIAPGKMLTEFLEETLPLAVALQSEKAKSELLISPILVEVRKILKREVSFFQVRNLPLMRQSGCRGSVIF